jgi:ribosomal protein S17E
MKKFPQIKWYQDDNNIFITILENGNNYKITNDTIFLNYLDDKYEFNLELFDEFTIIDSKKNKNNIDIFLNKKNKSEWKSLLKDRKLYKYFISLDWDKFATQSKSTIPLTADLSNNSLFNEEEFKYLLESGELDKISSDSETETNSET